MLAVVADKRSFADHFTTQFFVPFQSNCAAKCCQYSSDFRLLIISYYSLPQGKKPKKVLECKYRTITMATNVKLSNYETAIYTGNKPCNEETFELGHYSDYRTPQY